MKMKNALIVNGGHNSTKRDQLGNYDLIVAVAVSYTHLTLPTICSV